MIKNKVIEVLEKEIGTDVLSFISGNVEHPGIDSCKLSDRRGSVYGFAIKLSSDDEIKAIFENQDKNLDFSSWKSLGDDYYPLYWGKDINMGARLYSHTKQSKSTRTIQLNKRAFLKDREIIYGAIPCSDSAEIEKRLHEKYPDILKTKKGEEDNLTVSQLSVDE